jgi:thiamine biosynthesis protein ThiS
MSNKITLHLNGEPREVAQGTNLTSLVATFNQDPRGIAIERNRDIVPNGCVLADGDRLEVVVFVGGG